jgi:predicted RecA/RadA family phage recombinase
MALTADKQLEMKDPGGVIRLAMVASKTIYQGSMVSIVGASGLAQASADAASDIFAGIAVEQAVSAASGTTYVKVFTEGVFRLLAASIEQADVGKAITVSDDQTVTDSASTNDIPVGILVEYVAATDGWVHIRPFAAAAAQTMAT